MQNASQSTGGPFRPVKLNTATRLVSPVRSAPLRARPDRSPSWRSGERWRREAPRLRAGWPADVRRQC